MQTALEHPDILIPQKGKRRVTYQVLLCGSDGVVLASDQSELNQAVDPYFNTGLETADPSSIAGHGFTPNRVRKIYIDEKTNCMGALGWRTRKARCHISGRDAPQQFGACMCPDQGCHDRSRK